MNKLELLDEIVALFDKNWREPVDGRQLPKSRRLLALYLKVMRPPEKKRPLPSENVYGYTSVRIVKVHAKCAWDVFGLSPADQQGVKVCQVAWRLAYDDSEIWEATNAGDTLSALEACLAFAPLVEEDIFTLRKRAPSLPAQPIERDLSRWDTSRRQRPKKKHKKKIQNTQESSFCLKRQISLD